MPEKPASLSRASSSSGDSTGKRAPIPSAAFRAFSGGTPDVAARRQIQHLGRGIDADEPPCQMPFGKRLQFETTASTQHEKLRIAAAALGEKQGRHPLQMMKAGHEAHRAFGIASDGVRIGEARHGRHDYRLLGWMFMSAFGLAALVHKIPCSGMPAPMAWSACSLVVCLRRSQLDGRSLSSSCSASVFGGIFSAFSSS